VLKVLQMTTKEAKPAIAAVNELFSKSPDGLREIVRAVMQEMLEAEMTDALGAEKGERTVAGRRRCRCVEGD
jgi:transposase-like protein